MTNLCVAAKGLLHVRATRSSFATSRLGLAGIIKGLGGCLFGAKQLVTSFREKVGRKVGKPTISTQVFDIIGCVAELEDIPGTRVFTAQRARKGYWINQFSMSLMKAENRERFKTDERAYLDEWQISEEAKAAILVRNYNALLDLGGNIYFLSKIFSTDGISFAEAVATMTDMEFPEYREMMLKGGRTPIGNRSIKGGY